MPTPPRISADGLIMGRKGRELLFKKGPEDIHSEVLEMIREHGKDERLLAVGHDTNFAVRVGDISDFVRHFPRHQAPAPRMFALPKRHHYT